MKNLVYLVVSFLFIGTTTFATTHSTNTASLFASTVGTYNVQIIMRNSSLTQGVATTTDISAAVWQANVDGGVAGEVLTSADKNAKISVALSA